MQFSTGATHLMYAIFKLELITKGNFNSGQCHQRRTSTFVRFWEIFSFSIIQSVWIHDAFQAGHILSSAPFRQQYHLQHFQSIRCFVISDVQLDCNCIQAIHSFAEEQCIYTRTTSKKATVWRWLVHTPAKVFRKRFSWNQNSLEPSYVAVI